MRTVMAVIISLTFAAVGLADVNVLIIGSEKDSVESRRVRGKSQSFSPAGVKEQLEKILKGADLGKVNVVLKERCILEATDEELNAQIDARLQHMKNIYKKHYKNRKPPEYTPEARQRMIKGMRSRGTPCYSLATWFHWPYPLNVETKTRWPGLRGEKGTKWDYVVLIGDPYTIEYIPGLYSHGVAKIAEEVAKGKGKGKTVLLMSWPGPKSESKVAHYKEVTYRTGRSGGIMVAPAGLAWEAAGKPSGDTHPSKDGAYIAAASIFSRVWKKNAKTSSYTYKDALADKVFATVKKNVGAKHYAGTFDFRSPFRIFDRKNRKVCPCKAPGGSSTETALASATAEMVRRAGVLAVGRRGGGDRFTIGRDSGNRGKDYRGGAKEYKHTAFGYRYQSNTQNCDTHLEQIFSQDIDLADQVMHESDTFRAIPRRLIWASMNQANPAIRPLSSHNHLSHEASMGCAAFIYTIYSGRCPLNPKPNPVTSIWLAEKEGYEAAWRLGRCQVRAPGFKVLPANPERLGITPGKSEAMTVQFILPPQKKVSVKISAGEVATVSPSTLTFTPENYSIPKKIVVTGKRNAKPKTAFDVVFTTKSEDVVCDGVQDKWPYIINNAPHIDKNFKVADSKLRLSNGAVSTTASVAASDVDGDKLSYSWRILALDPHNRKVSGPAAPTIGPADKEFSSAKITFPAVGNYAIKGTVTDGLLPVSKLVYVSVLPPDLKLRKPENPANTRPGIDWTLIVTEGKRGKKPTPKVQASGVISYPRLRGGEPRGAGYRFKGYVKVPKDGIYTFFLGTNAASHISIGDAKVVDMPNSKRTRTVHGVIGLRAGLHAIEVYHSQVGRELTVEWAGPDFPRQFFDSSSMFRAAK